MTKEEFDQRSADNDGICVRCGLVHYEVALDRNTRCRNCNVPFDTVRHTRSRPTFHVDA